MGCLVENLEAKMAPTVEHGSPGPGLAHHKVIDWVLGRCQGSSRPSRCSGVPRRRSLGLVLRDDFSVAVFVNLCGPTKRKISSG